MRQPPIQIARDSLHYAAGFVYEVKEAASSLTHFAERGHIVPEFNDPKIRELFVGNYRLIYQVATKNIYVIAFVHGRETFGDFGNKAGKFEARVPFKLFSVIRRTFP